MQFDPAAVTSTNSPCMICELHMTLTHKVVFFDNLSHPLCTPKWLEEAVDQDKDRLREHTR